MAYFASSVSVEESLDKVVEYTNDNDHLHTFVSAIEGHSTVGEVAEWYRLGDRLRHRVEWKADAYQGWLDVNREGEVASISIGVHTGDRAGMDARLDAALVGLKKSIEAVDADDIRKAESSRSLVVETVLKGLIHAIPAPQRTAMAPYLTRARHLDGRPSLEERRAHMCVHWAREAAEQAGTGMGRLAAEIAERVEHLEGEVDAVLVEGERRVVDDVAKVEHFDPRILGEGEVTPGFHERLNDVYDALKEAHKIAAHRGWDAVPWPALLGQLFAVDDRG
jgi:hypothetical protein